MNFITKYSLGDRVCAISSCAAERIVKCITCEHTGKVKIGNEEFVCPKCKGKASHPVFSGYKWFISEKDARIGKIDIEITHEDYLYPKDQDKGHKLEIRYMLDATGVGSGAMWKEEELFESRALAQATCDERNAKLPPSEV